jgi:hypothetical protein
MRRFSVGHVVASCLVYYRTSPLIVKFLCVAQTFELGDFGMQHSNKGWQDAV